MSEMIYLNTGANFTAVQKYYQIQYHQRLFCVSNRKTKTVKSMDIIFVTLPKYLVPISTLLRKLGYRVFYLKLSRNKNIITENISVEKLKHAGILPLPFEDIAFFKDYSEMDSDPEMKSFKRVQEIAPLEFLQVFEKLFPNIPNLSKKLQIAVHSTVSIQMMYVTGKVNIWAGAHPDRNYLLIDVDPLCLTAPKLAPNVRLFVIPLDILGTGMASVTNIVRNVPGSLKSKLKFKGHVGGPTKTHSEEAERCRIALVTHQGLNYGNLFLKDLFYSTRRDSELHPEKLLYFDYSGVGSPSGKLKWVYLGDHRQSWISNISSALVAIRHGILHIRHFRHILGLLILARIYVIFRSFSTKLESYPDLKMALIDYEILCPKELLLAFESKGIQTVAAQERFFFSFYNSFGTILNYYLCGSQYAADSMKLSPLYSVDHFLPVGQYRSDNLLEAKKSPPPHILVAPIDKGLKIITALGFHTHTEWQNSQLDPMLSWKAHQQFLDDIIRLSSEIPDIFIILRYKYVDWMSLPIFAETIQKIKTTDNITISIDYEKSFFSYDLCAHSDLVIAKPTSLTDECLAAGIPVLFHEYTHNTKRLVADAIAYTPARILCFNYQDLKERVQIILSGSPNAITEDYDYLRKVVYGGLGDGRVKERIHTHLEKKIAEL